MMKASPPSSQVWPNGTICQVKAKGWKTHYGGQVQSFDTATGIYTVKFDDGEVRSDVKEFHFKGPPPKQTFTAPDGTTFDNRNAYRRHLADTMYSFKNKTGETLTKTQGTIDGQSFTITNLNDCTVQLMDQSDQVLIDGVKNCRILVGPSCESVFVRNATNCTFFIACKQFRSRDCSNCTVSLYTKTEPIVETSSGMRFYPYRCAYPGQTEHFKKANLIPDKNHWCNVFDFNAGDSSIPEPHWSLIPESDEGWPEWRIENEDSSEPQNPVPLHARAVALEREGAFGFGLTQEQAESAHQASNAATEQSAPVVPPQAPTTTPSVAPPSINNNTDILPTATATNTEPNAPKPPPTRITKHVDPAPFTLAGVKKGSIAVITGGASGIGFETAKRCFAHGMSVAIADIDSKQLEAAEAILRSFDAQEEQHVLACVLDVADPLQVSMFEQQIRALYADKPITFVLNNAGVVGGLSILNSSPQESKSVFDTNVHGVMHVFQSFVPGLVKQDTPCTIVTTSSVAGLLPVPSGVYTASKHAVTAVAECIYHEVKQLDGGHKLSTHVLCPSYVATAMWTNGPHTVTDKDTQSVCDAIHKVAEEKGLSTGEVVSELFKGVEQGKFYIIANDPDGKGEIEAMVKARANVIAEGAQPRQPTQQKITQEIQKEILSA